MNFLCAKLFWYLPTVYYSCARNFFLLKLHAEACNFVTKKFWRRRFAVNFATFYEYYFTKHNRVTVCYLLYINRSLCKWCCNTEFFCSIFSCVETVFTKKFHKKMSLKNPKTLKIFKRISCLKFLSYNFQKYWFFLELFESDKIEYILAFFLI